MLWIALQKNDTVRSDPCRAGTELIDGQRLGEPAGGLVAGVEEDEVVSRPAHLVKSPAVRDAHNRPIRAQSLRRQTIHTASRTIPLFILLTPCVRSVNTIGISIALKPFRKALKVISIWKA